MAKQSSCLTLPSTRYLEHHPDELPANEPGPDELTFAHMDGVVDEDCRYAQKVSRRRKRVFRWAMGRIPLEEREAVRLSLLGKSQQEIGEIQGVSQVQVLYRLRMAQRRLQWLCTVGARVTAGKIREATVSILSATDHRILLAWWDTGSQTKAALRVYGDCNKQKKCRDSLIRSRTIIKNIGRLWRISRAIESVWNDPWLHMNMFPSDRPAGRIKRLSKRTLFEGNCTVGAKIPPMVSCVSGDETL